jgi:hypothetical protein
MGAVAATAFALAACSDNIKQDLATCKLRAIDTLHLTLASDKETEADADYYVQVCMEAAGYELNLSMPVCGQPGSRWLHETCYQRTKRWAG